MSDAPHRIPAMQIVLQPGLSLDLIDCLADCVSKLWRWRVDVERQNGGLLRKNVRKMTQNGMEMRVNWNEDQPFVDRHGKQAPMQLLKDGGVKICSPMVRYSKLPFRSLVRRYGCDLAFTPMIVANSFVCSAKARDNEFTTNSDDHPLIVQFAANNAKDFADASELVARYCDGVDLNCGCPQRWAIQEGYGVALIDEPELIRDIIKQTRSRLHGDPESFTISTKIRIHQDVAKTVDLCRQIEHAGASWITVHGRTRNQRKEPVDMETVNAVVQSVRCPVVVNGDIKSLEDCRRLEELTGAKGFMCARGLLQNPAMFADFKVTPTCCLQDWVDITIGMDTSFTLFHQHLIYMCERILPKAERRIFNTLNSTAAVLDYLSCRYGIRAPLGNSTTSSSSTMSAEGQNPT